LILFTATFSMAAAAQSALDVKIRVDGQKAEITGVFTGKRVNQANTLVFLESTLGSTKLAERITDVAVFDAGGNTLVLKRFAASHYVASETISKWSYNVDLRPGTSQSAAAHTSWISGDAGVLMLDDLLPQEGRVPSSVSLELPVSWKVFTSEASGTTFQVADVQKGVFFIGSGWRIVDSPGARIAVSGAWQFSDAEAWELTQEILERYAKLFGGAPHKLPQIAILKFPNAVQPGQWEADTRGSTVTIVSSDTPFKSQSIQRLHEQLRHEIFHLWLPNGVNFSGNYDWFYEGFALYQSLKLGVTLNRIRFDDYLATLSAAYNIDRRISTRRSLIDSARSRSSGAGLEVYARGMLVALLTDIALLNSSKGKRSTDDLLREIYQKHSPGGARVDGNDAIKGIMRTRPELIPVVDRYIAGTEPIDIGSAVIAAGLNAAPSGREISLQVVKKPNGRQKDLLDRLGYNNWRKSASR
jgi:predicted metalloprotease with PDZ domain